MEYNNVCYGEGFWAWMWRTCMNNSWSLVGWFFIVQIPYIVVLNIVGAPLWLFVTSGAAYSWVWNNYTRPYFFPRQDFQEEGK